MVASLCATGTGDLAARDHLLQGRTLPSCHELHFLQMACEKLCKARLMAHPNADPMVLQKSHAYVSKNLPLLLKEVVARNARHLPKESHVVTAIRALARQIERLAPANQAGGTAPSNCEYPWIGPAGQIVVPAKHNFGLGLLYERSGRTLLKSLWIACDELASASGEQP